MNTGELAKKIGVSKDELERYFLYEKRNKKLGNPFLSGRVMKPVDVFKMIERNGIE